MRFYYLTLLLSVLCTCGRAQVTLTGLVTDAESADPLPFVYVQLRDANLGTVTEADGKYRLQIPRQHTGKAVTFSYLGYESTTIAIAELRQDGNVTLRQTSTRLTEITVTPKKLPSARVILRRVFANLDENYPKDFHELTGYYRETMKENGAYIKFTDAAVQYRTGGYPKKKIRWKEYGNPSGWGTTLSGLFFDARQSLHRSHFHHNTRKTDQVRIFDSRASLNGSQRNMNGNIQGGPLSLLGRDRIKFQQSFLGPKRFRDFDYLVDEEQDENGRWIYVLNFRTVTTKERLEELSAKYNETKKWRHQRRRWAYANKHKMLTGKIYVDPENYAILGYETRVPNELKPYFCGYTTMVIKHFDYKLSVRFKPVNGKYVLDYLRHEDEFIFKDTTDQTTTPYAAISEFRNLSTQLNAGPAYPALDNFANVNTNELYEYALEYDSVFWQDYHARYPETVIDHEIRTDMETDKTLEQQFHDK
ncbi:MAG: carboxypeptidase-like regulatory domain-containing protein, partial [Bacteroidota bacterium]